MGYFRFRKSVKIAPGVKLNFNKNSTSVTFGGKGAHYTVNSKGTKTTSFSIPGTGLSYVDVQKTRKKGMKSHNYRSQPKQKKELSNEEKNENYILDNQSPHLEKPFSDSESKQKQFLLQRTWFIVLMMILIPPVGLFFMWYYKEWKTSFKILISIIFIIYSMIYFVVITR